MSSSRRARGWWCESHDRCPSCDAATVAHPRSMTHDTTAKLGDTTSAASASARCSSPAPACSARRATATARSPSCAAPSSSASTTSTRRSTTDPTSSTTLIRDALHPYPEGLRLVTKVGARRDDQGAWLPALRPAELRAGVEDNLRTLGVEQLDARQPAPARRGAGDRDVRRSPRCSARSTTCAGRASSSSSACRNVDARPRRGGARARPDRLRAEPVLGARPLGRGRARRVPRARARLRALLPARQRLHGRPGEARRDAAIAAVAAQARRHALAGRSRLAAAPRRALLLIPGTSSVAHLEENLAAADVELDAEDLAALEDVEPAGDALEAVHD